jgi:TAP C-terminal domain
VKFSVDCLTGNGWDLERAVANFEQVKVNSFSLTRGYTLTVYTILVTGYVVEGSILVVVQME